MKVVKWNDLKLPLDVWGLDMNWRNSDNGHGSAYTKGQDHFYDYPNTDLLPDLADPGTAWFDWLKAQKVHALRLPELVPPVRCFDYSCRFL